MYIIKGDRLIGHLAFWTWANTEILPFIYITSW